MTKVGSCQDRVKTCLPCIQRWAERTNRYENTSWGDDCTACHTLEMTEGFATIMHYNGWPACDWWEKRVNLTKVVQAGREISPLWATLDDVSRSAEVRYAHSSRTDDP